jgi:rhomboid protease GluP
MTDKSKAQRKTGAKLSYDSPVILTFALLALIVYIIQSIFPATTYKYFCIYDASVSDPLFYVRLFGYTLGHANFTHFISNIGMLLLIGPSVEEKYGSGYLVASMVFTAVAGGLAHCLLTDNLALLGASGIVFMLMFLSVGTRTKDGRIALSFILVALIYLGGAIYDMIFTSDNVSQLGHLVGGFCGIGCGALIDRYRDQRKTKKRRYD